MGLLEIVSTLLGALVGGSGSALSKWMGMKETAQAYAHELALIAAQRASDKDDREAEMAIVQERAYVDMRESSYRHDAASGAVSRWVSNTLRMVRPVLTLLLIVLVWAIWFTIGAEDVTLRYQIVDGVLFMASAALAWWFGDRAPSSKRLPWQ